LGLKPPGSSLRGLETRSVALSGLPATILAMSEESFRPPEYLAPPWPGIPAPRAEDVPTRLTPVFLTSLPPQHRHDEGVVFCAAPYKYVRDRVQGRERLYHIGRDPHEVQPLEADHPETLRRGRRLFD